MNGTEAGNHRSVRDPGGDVTPLEYEVDIGDTAIRVLEWAGGGPPLLLLHATGFLPWMWHPIARELAEDYRVVAPYLCSHRRAEPEEGGLSWEQLAGDVATLCRRLEMDRPYAVGHSMGGAVLTIAGGKLGVSFSKMVLIEPILLPEEVYGISIGVSDHPLASKSIRRRNFWKDRQAVRDYLESKSFFRSWDAEMLALYSRHAIVAGDEGGFTLACQPRQEAALFMGSMAINPWPLMPQIEAPVLLLEGETSENRGFIDLEGAAKRFSNGSYRLIQGAGHLIPMEMPDKTLHIIREFFGKVPGGAPQKTIRYEEKGGNHGA